ncbi:MAG: crotonase/enoyl-CoA hydratase family protein [Myxococcota bacterium]|nr:crotonase/enoyl-CoA hydratase family protein [Myxococcota bacterium]
MLDLQIDGHIAQVVLNNPAKRNAMGPWFWDEMPKVFRQIDEDLDVRVAVVRAEGRSFSAGLDLMAMMPRLPIGAQGADTKRQAKLHRLIRDMQEAVTCVERCRVPVIAAIQGHCIGGGVDLVTACDIRLASEDAVFSVREVKMAIVADIGSLQRLPRVVTPGIARELALTGRDFGAAYAESIGLVNRVLPDVDALQADAMATAGEIASNAPAAVQGTKQVMNQAIASATDRGLEYVATWNAAYLISQDLGRAVQGFVSKTKPEFTGE